MRTGFTYDAKSAARADESRTLIKTTGAYVLTIRQCAVKNTQSGAEMIDFILKNESTGEIALTNLCTLDKNGNVAFGADIFNAILTVLGITGAVDFVPGAVYKLNGEKEDGYRVPIVEKKSVGLLLQYKERVNQYGEAELDQNNRPKYNMIIRSVFHPETRQTASELIKGKQASRLDYEIKKWQDSFAKPPTSHSDEFESAPRTQAASYNAYTQAPATSPVKTSPSDIQDDDIPF